MKNKFKIVLAPDSFKESMSSQTVCDAMARGINKIDSKIECVKIPMADGGEGTMNSLVAATGGDIHKTTVLDPLGRNIEATYGILGGGEIAVIEMASASGIQLVEKSLRNPLVTTTYGTGQLIKACLEHPIKKVLVGIGGSATNDGGAGMFQALGGRLLDQEGNELSFGGGQLDKLVTIDSSDLDPRVKDVTFEVACDVDNPLVGPTGAAHIYGPQKGADESMVLRLDKNMAHYGKLIEEHVGKKIADIPGAGAAGGLGAGLVAFLDGSLISGIEMVIEYTCLSEHIKNADMVWTGEGSIDYQTAYGKTPHGVAQIAKSHGVPVIALAGHVGENVEVLYESGIDSIFSIVQGVSTLEEALIDGVKNIEKTSENIIRCLKSII